MVYFIPGLYFGLSILIGHAWSAAPLTFALYIVPLLILFWVGYDLMYGFCQTQNHRFSRAQSMLMGFAAGTGYLLPGNAQAFPLYAWLPTLSIVTIYALMALDICLSLRKARFA